VEYLVYQTHGWILMEALKDRKHRDRLSLAVAFGA
jgi:hypothetical protein